MTTKEKLIEQIILYPNYAYGFIKSLGFTGHNIAESIIGRDVGIEFERRGVMRPNIYSHLDNIAEQYDMLECKIDNHCDIGNNNNEIKCRYNKLYNKLDKFKAFLHELGNNTQPAKGLGIHIHIDWKEPLCSQTKERYIADKFNPILNTIYDTIFEYKGSYNKKAIGVSSKGNIITTRRRFSTIEYRGGDCITDYSTIIYWIICCQAATNYVKYNNKHDFNNIVNFSTNLIKRRRVHQIFVN